MVSTCRTWGATAKVLVVSQLRLSWPLPPLICTEAPKAGGDDHLVVIVTGVNLDRACKPGGWRRDDIAHGDGVAALVRLDLGGPGDGHAVEDQMVVALARLDIELTDRQAHQIDVRALVTGGQGQPGRSRRWRR